MCNVNKSTGNVNSCNFSMCEVFLCRLKFMSMNKHVFIVLLSILGLTPVSLFSRSRVVNDTIFSKN